jgi:hypothetical protein
MIRKNTEHVSLIRQNAKEKGRGKGLIVVWNRATTQRVKRVKPVVKRSYRQRLLLHSLQVLSVLAFLVPKFKYGHLRRGCPPSNTDT